MIRTSQKQPCFVGTTLCIWSAMIVASTAGGAAGDELFYQPANSNWTRIESLVTSSPPQDLEAADDFDVVGIIERVIAAGDDCFNCAPPTVAGVYVRFYEWTADGPGGLQHETFLSAEDPGFLYDVDGPRTLDITLVEPFEATGQHFMSVQLVLDGSGYWGLYMSNHHAPNGSPLRYRDNLGGEAWGDYIDGLGDPVDSDLAFTFYGTPEDSEEPSGCGAWELQASPNPSESDQAILRDLTVVAPDDIWAVGNYLAPDSGSLDRFTLIEHFDGSSWSIVPSPSPSPAPGFAYCDLNTVAATGPEDIWSAGKKNDLASSGGWVGQHCLAMHYDGSEWSAVDVPLPPGGSSEYQNASGDHINDIAAIAPDDVWFVGQYFHFLPSDAVIWPALVMHYDGSDLEVIEEPFFDVYAETLTAVSAVSSDDVWAVGVRSDPANRLIIYHYDGAEWAEFPAPSPGSTSVLSDVTALAADDVWASGSYTDAGGLHVLMLHFDGDSWTQFDSPAGGTKLAAASSNDIYSSGDYNLSRWNGTAWELEDVGGLEDVPVARILSIAALGSCELVGVGMQSIAGQLMTLTARLEPFDELQPGDLDGDGSVGAADLALLLGSWGLCGDCGDCPADLNGDCTVGAADLAILLGNWG